VNAPPACVIFDLDGTLVDSVPDLHAAANQTLAEAGLAPLTLDIVRGFVGDGVPVLVARCFEHHGVAPQDEAKAVAYFLARYDALEHAQTTVYPGVAEALAALREAGVRTAVCTNKPALPAEALLRAKGLADLFDALVGGDTLPVRKPDPAPLLLCAESVGVAVDDAVYVGDSEIDAETARRANVPFILHTRGYRKHPQTPAGARGVFDSFRELPGLIAALAGKAKGSTPRVAT